MAEDPKTAVNDPGFVEETVAEEPTAKVVDPVEEKKLVETANQNNDKRPKKRQKIKLSKGDFSNRVNIEILQQELDGFTGKAYEAGIAILRDKKSQKITGAILVIENPNQVDFNMKALKALIKDHKVKPEETDEARREKAKADEKERSKVMRKLPKTLKDFEARLSALEGNPKP